MQKTLGLLLAATIAILVGLWFWQDPVPDAVSDPHGDESTEDAPSAPIDLRAKEPRAADHASSNSLPIPTEMEQLQAELTAAEAAVELADAHLEDLSLRLDSLEAQIADIEARGDDPADHAEEVMPYMQPVLNDFLEAQAELDAALERRDAIKAALEQIPAP